MNIKGIMSRFVGGLIGAIIGLIISLMIVMVLPFNGILRWVCAVFIGLIALTVGSKMGKAVFSDYFIRHFSREDKTDRLI